MGKRRTQKERVVKGTGLKWFRTRTISCRAVDPLGEEHCFWCKGKISERFIILEGCRGSSEYSEPKRSRGEISCDWDGIAEMLS